MAPGAWEEVRLEGGEGLRARLPYVRKRRLGVTVLTQPPLTPMLGPWLAPSSAGYAKQLSQEHELMDELIGALPAFDLFRQAFHHSVTNWLPFYWAGFQASVKYTYRIEDLSDLDRTRSELRSKVRQSVRKAERELTVRDDLGLDVFLDLNAKTYARQGLGLPYPPELVRRVDRACAQRDARRMLFAVDGRGSVHAALYLVRDSHSTYHLMSGADPDLRASGAGTLLTWEAIKGAAGVTPAFDFEGSMIRPVERYVREFGARQVPYLHVTRESRRGRAASALQAMRRGHLGRVPGRPRRPFQRGV